MTTGRYHVIRHSISFDSTENKLGVKYPSRYLLYDPQRYTLNQARKVLRNNDVYWTQFICIADGPFATVCGAVEKPVGEMPQYVTLKGRWMIEKDGSLGKKLR